MDTNKLKFKTLASISKTPEFKFFEELIKFDEEIQQILKKNEDKEIFDFFLKTYSEKESDDNFVSYFSSIVFYYSKICQTKNELFAEIIREICGKNPERGLLFINKMKLFLNQSKQIAKTSGIDYRWKSLKVANDFSFINLETNVRELMEIIIKDDVDKLKQFLLINDAKRLPLLNFSSFIRESDLSMRIEVLDSCALFGGIKCFDFLLVNGYEFGNSIQMSAIIGGNFDIIHKVEEAKYSFDNLLHISFKYHHKDISDWLLSNYLCEEVYPQQTFIYMNLRAFLFLSLNGFSLGYDNEITRPININELFEFPEEIQPFLQMNSLAPNISILMNCLSFQRKFNLSSK